MFVRYTLLHPASINIGVGVCLVVSRGQRIAGVRYGHGYENVLSRTCKLEQVLVGIDLVESERLVWYRVLNHCLVGRLLWYGEI